MWWVMVRLDSANMNIFVVRAFIDFYCSVSVGLEDFIGTAGDGSEFALAATFLGAKDYKHFVPDDIVMVNALFVLFSVIEDGSLEAVVFVFVPVDFDVGLHDHVALENELAWRKTG